MKEVMNSLSDSEAAGEADGRVMEGWVEIEARTKASRRQRCGAPSKAMQRGFSCQKNF